MIASKWCSADRDGVMISLRQGIVPSIAAALAGHP